MVSTNQIDENQRMPQLDIVTYFNQVTWFSLVFTGFFLAMVTDVLPRLNRAVKLRQKKLAAQHQALLQFDGLRTTGERSYDKAIVDVMKREHERIRAQRQGLLASAPAKKDSHGRWGRLGLESSKASKALTKSESRSKSVSPAPVSPVAPVSPSSGSTTKSSKSKGVKKV